MDFSPTFIRSALSRFVPGQCVWVSFSLIVLLIAGGCASPVAVTSDPEGASVKVDDGRSATTPAKLEFPSRPKPYVLTFSKDGFASATKTYQPGQDKGGIFARLDSLRENRTFRFTSVPEGAEVRLLSSDGAPPRLLGVTPFDAEITFSREAFGQPWQQFQIELSLRSYETTRVPLVVDIDRSDRSAKIEQPVKLELLELSRSFQVSAKASGVGALAATAYLDDRQAAVISREKGGDLAVFFSRKSSRDPWPTFTLSVENDLYEPRVVQLAHDSSSKVDLTLAPLTRVVVERPVYEVAMVQGTAAARWIMEKRDALVNISEGGNTLVQIEPVTSFKRLNPREPVPHGHAVLNSFAITPDGEYVILSLVSTDSKGNRDAVLHIKNINDPRGYSRELFSLRQGGLDTMPVAATDFSDNDSFYLFFQSGGYRHYGGSGIYRAKLVKTSADAGGYIVEDNGATPMFAGELSQLYFAPASNYSSESQNPHGVMALVLNARDPKAKPQIVSTFTPQSAETYVSVKNEKLRELFVHSPDDTKRSFTLFTDFEPGVPDPKRKIFKSSRDGGDILLIGSGRFAGANCFNPAAYRKQDVPRILFVSDCDKDEGGRNNNNIYLRSPSGGTILQVIANGSDDIMPVWSPKDADVFYFMSNRSGAYNVWKATLNKELRNLK